MPPAHIFSHNAQPPVAARIALSPAPQRALYEDRKTGQKKAPYDVYNRTIKGACGNKLRAPFKCRKSPQNGVVAIGGNSRGKTPRAHAKQSIPGALFSRLLFPAPYILCKELLIHTF